MPATYRGQPGPRHNTYHGPKRNLLGNHSGAPPPAWRPQNMPGGPQAARKPAPRPQPGSKILLSNLPKDVGQDEVEDLFRKTIGAVTEAFVVYNSQGNSKGMAVVTFARPTDAGLAKQKYHGKIVDGRTPITIELIVNEEPRPAPAAPAAAPSGPPSLMSRISPVVNGATINGAATKGAKATSLTTRVGPPAGAPKAPKAKAPKVAPPVSAKRARMKKGPKRVKKTVNQLDREMEDYRAAIDTSGSVFKQDDVIIV